MSAPFVGDKGVTSVTVVTEKKLCCSVNKATTGSSVIRALGTVQIMVGVFNVGLGPERTGTYPYWLGALFIAAGVVSVLADMFPLVCSRAFAAFVNIVGSIFSIVGIVLYALHLANFSVIWMCGNNAAHNTDKNCTYVAYLAQKLLRGVDITLIILAVLQLCVCISLAVFSVRALCNRGRDEGVREAEIYQPLVKEVIITSPEA
ncbi:membrane-spanning 4-domains subfamily A member 12-like [Odontesthes bonariensis]|uniref:membrane-spanning 4-domains subfamily A member 12-like n=1 Tax=Odontesthes bonariensis TaxID=219752 RepID=UPI003F5833F1